MIKVIQYLSGVHFQWSAILAASMLSFCWFWLKPRFGSIPTALFAYSCLSALWVWSWKDNQYLSIDPYNQMALRYFACDSIAKIFIVLTPIVLLSENSFLMQLVGKVFAFHFFFLNAAIIAYEYFKGCSGIENGCGGIAGNPSISVGLTMTMLPLVIYSWKHWYLVLLAAAMAIISKSSIAVGVLALYSFLWLFPWKAALDGRRSWVPILASCASLVVVFGVARVAFGSELLNDSDRFKLWRNMMDMWAAPWNIPWGTGLGTYHVFSINLQDARHLFQVGPNHWNWWNTMHNEPLQFTFECGVFGVLLFIATCLSAMFRTFLAGNYRLLLSVFLFCAYMALNPGLHWPAPTLWAAWLFVCALRQPNTIEEIL